MRGSVYARYSYIQIDTPVEEVKYPYYLAKKTKVYFQVDMVTGDKREIRRS